MSLSEAPRTPKWPYLLADVILVATAAAVAWKAAPVWTWKEISLVGGLTGLGAWIFIQPFQKDHETAVKLFEQVNPSTRPLSKSPPPPPNGRTSKPSPTRR